MIYSAGFTALIRDETLTGICILCHLKKASLEALAIAPNVDCQLLM
jgi:hypothetical protein